MDDNGHIARLLTKKDLNTAEEEILYGHVKSIAMNVVREYTNLPEEEHEEIISLTMVRVNDERLSLKNTSNVNGWIYKISKNIAVDSFRKYKKSHPGVIHEEGDEVQGGGNLAVPHLRRQRLSGGGQEEEENLPSGVDRVVSPSDYPTRRQLEDALQALRNKGEMYYEVFIMKYKGLSSKEIGEKLGKTEENVDVIFLRARKFLKEYIESTGGR